MECDSALDGIYTSRRALDLAYEMGLDLVMVAPAANPPVCKITDYGKFKYDLSKQKKGEHDHKPKELKSLKISPLTALHDIEVQAKKATSFLTDGHRVRLICQFRARQLAHPEVGKEKMDALLALLAEAGKPEAPARLEGRMMTVLMIPCKK